MLSATPSRRGTLRLLVGSAFGGLFARDRDDAAAHNALKKCKKKSGKQKKKCRKKAKKHNARHVNQPPPCSSQCSGKVCGPDGCGDSCGSCAGGQLCAQGQCVTGQGTCAAGEDHCADRPQGANCGLDCLCFTTMDNQTRCGDGNTPTGCDPACTSDVECERQRPNIPGVFCAKDTGTFCGCTLGQGFCIDPCPSGTPSFCSVNADGTRCGGDANRCCGGVCVDTNSDEAHCGGCDQGCPANQPTCCAGGCVNTTTEEDHCAGCGNVCLADESCVASSCCELEADFCDPADDRCCGQSSCSGVILGDQVCCLTNDFPFCSPPCDNNSECAACCSGLCGDSVCVDCRQIGQLCTQGCAPGGPCPFCCSGNCGSGFTCVA